MNRELLLLRHGKSDWDVPVDDFHRPLKDRGKRAAQRMGVHLAQSNLLPDYVLSSPAERAINTAEKCLKTAGLPARKVQKDLRIYMAELDELLAVLTDSPQKCQRVMLVGHNPGLEQLLSYLAGDKVGIPEDGKLLPTGALAHLRIAGDWQVWKRGCAKLVDITRARSLPAKFPYPMPDGTDLRDRPAYYYTQSAVIPYRRRKSKIEILIVSSSGNKHWVVPKGIKDPGLTPQESAAKEAWEEAGAEGEVARQAIGSYGVEKWGATCQVSVYPMEVTRLAPEAEWEEQHRGRQWVSVDEAVEKLKQPALKQMTRLLGKRLGRKGR